MRRGWAFFSAVLLAGPAAALELSGQLTAASEWVDRGISQTAGLPALQGELELATESGLYLGAAASNVDFGVHCPERVQLDLIAGIARPAGPLRWDAGVTRSSFPGAAGAGESMEYRLGAGWRNIGLAVHWTPDFASLERPGWYFETEGEFELPWRALRLGLRVGYTGGSALHGRFAAETGLQPYLDWQVTLARDYRRLTVLLGWTDTSLRGQFRNRDPVERNDGRLVLALTAPLQ